MYFEFEARTQRGATWTPMIDVCEREAHTHVVAVRAGRDQPDQPIADPDAVVLCRVCVTGVDRQERQSAGRPGVTVAHRGLAPDELTIFIRDEPRDQIP